jgi:hypothetical protein
MHTILFCVWGVSKYDFLVILDRILGSRYAYGDPHMENVAYGDTRLDFPYGNISHMHTVSD